jgi:hypothetical protein
MKNMSIQFRRIAAFLAATALLSACSKEGEIPEVKDTSAESRAILDAARGATNSAEDALRLSEAAAARADINAADRAAALKAQQDALKKLAEDAAAGDAAAQSAIEQYRARK